MMMRYHYGLGIGHAYFHSYSGPQPRAEDSINNDDPLPDVAEESSHGDGAGLGGTDNQEESDDEGFLEEGEGDGDDVEDEYLEHSDDGEFLAFDEMYG
jgi:hypothetical protein